MASSSTPQKNYDVFLSFRGEDTRYNIVSHLYKALVDKRIRTFKDDRGLENGDIISEELIRSIKTSFISVVVISENYAASSWCLEELRQIMELWSDDQIKVVPIFYKVHPSDVRKQRGSFEAGLQLHNDQIKIIKWREALSQIGKMSGTHCITCTDEAQMVSNIVANISSRLQKMNPADLINLDNLFGMEEHMAKMSTLLNMGSENEVRIVGIWGMGGIGKTTIAKVLYDRFSGQFSARCFIEDIDKVYKDRSLPHLQEKFLFSILGGQHINILSLDEGCREIMSRLAHCKVFVVLDGVDKAEQVRALAKDTSWFCPGSRIIITTEDKGLLTSCRVNYIHEVKCLDNEGALQVFEKLAYRAGSSPCKDMKQLSIRTTKLAHGLPSAIVAYASDFNENTPIEQWKDELDILEEKPHKNVEEILMNSYNYLDVQDKIAFLYVACLLNGYPFTHVTSLLDNGRPRINHLMAKSLVSISANGCITMHALVVQTGREIVRQESRNRPFRQRCLWDSNDIHDVLAHKKGTDEIEGVTLDMCKMPGELTMSLTVFKHMHSIKFLKFYQQLGDAKSNVQIKEKGYYFPSTLRLLHWDALSLKTFPGLRHYKNLVEVDLRYSNLEWLWDRTVKLPNLRRLDVTGSENLIKLPDLSTTINFEELIVEDCKSLLNIIESLNSLDNLTKFNAVNCLIGYVTFTCEDDRHNEVWLGYRYERMLFNYLRNLSMEGEILISLSGLEGETDHISFSSKQDTYNMQSLNIKKFRYKVDFNNPFRIDSMESLSNLTELKLVNLNIQKIPDSINCMKILETLDLSGNDFEYLPISMEELPKLKYLSLQNCRKIRSLPKLGQVKTLILSDCENLQSLFQPAGNNIYSLLEIWLENCKNVDTLSHQLHHFTDLIYLDLSRNDFVKVPSSIKELSSLRTIFLNNCKNLKSVEHELPLSLTHLYARGCDSLVNVSLSPNNSIKHLDLINCPRLDGEEKDQMFFNDEHSNEDPMDTEAPSTEQP